MPVSGAEVYGHTAKTEAGTMLNIKQQVKVVLYVV